MALAFYINGPDDIAHAFAAHDEYLAIFTHYYFRSRKGEENVRALRPDVDDYYSAPYCFLPKRNNNNNRSNNTNGSSSSSSCTSGFLVFTCMVPYLHGNPWTCENNNNKQQQQQQHQRAHYQAKEWMEENCNNKNSNNGNKSRAPHVGSVEEFASSTHLNIASEYNIFTFTIDGGYPTCMDVSSSLEDDAVSVTCSAMGWKIPINWRDVRKRIVNLHDIPILDLALWDKEQQLLLQQQQEQEQQQQQQQQQECQHDSKMKTTNNNIDVEDTATIYNDNRGDSDNDDDDGRPDRNDNDDDGWKRRANKVQRNDKTVGNDTSVGSNSTVIVDVGGGGGGTGGTSYARCVTAEASSSST